jgi:hypothetical protein
VIVLYDVLPVYPIVIVNSFKFLYRHHKPELPVESEKLNFPPPVGLLLVDFVIFGC